MDDKNIRLLKTLVSALGQEASGELIGEVRLSGKWLTYAALSAGWTYNSYGSPAEGQIKAWNIAAG